MPENTSEGFLDDFVDPKPTSTTTSTTMTPFTGGMVPVTPTDEDFFGNIGAIWDGIQTIGRENPELAHQLSLSPSSLAITQEAAAGLQDGEITSYVVSALVGDDELVPFNEAIDRLDNNSELVSQFFQDYSGDFLPHEKDFLAYILAPLDAKRKDQTLALTNQYIEANGLTDEQARTSALLFAAQTAQGKFNEIQGEENTFLGQLGKAVDFLGRPLREFASDIWARTADPQDSVYREHLSIGQNIAVSLGQTPGTEGWQISSGIADGIAQFALDPTNLVIGFGAGRKLAQTFPRIGEVGRAGTAARTLVPWFGKNATNLPRFSRGFTTRLGWAFFSKNTDEFFEVGQAGAKLADTMFNTAKSGGVAALIEQFPRMSNALDGIGELIVRAENPNQVVDILREGLNGGFLKADGAGRSVLKLQAEQAERTYNQVVDDALRNGDIGVGDVGGFQGFNIEAGIWDAGGSIPEAGTVLSRVDYADTGAERIVFRGKVKTLDLSTPAEARKVARWLQDNGGSPGDNVLANRILAGNFGFTDQMLDRLQVYANAAGADILSFGDQSILTGKGAQRAAVGRDMTVGGEAMLATATDLAEDLFRKQKAYRSSMAGDTDLWLLNEMPEQARGRWRMVKHLWRDSASNDANSWYAQSRRIRSARIFNKRPPATISIDNTSEMVEGMKRLARSFGASRSQINDMVNRLADVKMMDRYDAVQREITTLAEVVDHPLLQHRLVEYVRDQAVREFMPGPGGTETAVAIARTDGAAETAVPLIPSLMRRQVQLPGPDFQRSLLRYRQSKNSRLPFITGRGVTAGTRNRRRKIVQTLKRRLQDKAKANPELADEIAAIVANEDQLFAMAYASVMEGGIGNGIGNLAKAGAALGKGVYTPIHSLFSVAQLALRPVSWMMRVNLDEQARGALFDLPSIMRNPGRMTQHWWDAYHISKAEKWAAENTVWMSQTGRKILTGSDDVVLRRVQDLFPEARRILGDDASPRAIANFVHDRLRDIADGKRPLRTLGNQMNMGRWAQRRARARARGIRRTEAIKEKYGLDPTFVWDDAAEIQMKGTHQILADEMGASVTPLDWTSTLTQEGAYNFGTAWAAKAGQYSNDPMMRIAMRAAIRQGQGKSIASQAQQMINSKFWPELRTNYRRLAAQRGWDISAGDAAIAERVLAEVLIPQVDHVFSPLWGSAADDLLEKGRVLEDLLSPGRATTVTAHDGIEYTFDFRKGGNAHLREEMRKFAIEEHHRQIHGLPRAGMPDRIAAQFDPLFLHADGGARIPQAWRKFTDFMIGTFGEKATQGLNRRPAFLATHRRAFRRFKALGLDDDAARMAANGEAIRLTNYVYYNMDDTVPLLAKMNKVIPFFSAAWEVAQTWAYKIPKELAGGGGFMFGTPRMIRTVDRFFDAFINSGLLQITEDGSYQLVLSSDLGRGEAMPVSNFLSDAGRKLVNTPFTVVQHLHNWANDLWDGEDIKLGAAELRLTVAAPIDPTGDGVGNALSFHLGMNPLISYALGQVKNDIYNAVDAKTHETQGGTFGEISEQTGVQVGELLRANKEAIVERIGKSEYQKLLTTSEDNLREFVLPSGIELHLPGTSLIGSVIDEVFFPYDSTSTPWGTFFHMQPSWSKYIWRGFGLWQNNSSLPGLLSTFDGPMGQAQMDSATIDALRHMEAQSGAITKLNRKRDALKAFVDEQEGVFLADLASGEVTPLAGVSAEQFAAAEEQFQELWQDMDDYAMSMLNRAGDLAGGQLLTRGLFGLFLPSNPQTFQAEAYMEDDYYESRDFAAGETIPTLKNAKDFESFIALMNSWWDDETGDSAKLLLQQMNPGMEMFFKGKSYWVDGTVPAEIEDIDDYFRQIKEGTREIKPPEVYLMDEAFSGVGIYKEAQIREQFGADPVTAWTNILNNYADYKALSEEMELEYNELEYFDDLVFDGAYADYQARERRSAPGLAQEIRLAVLDKFRNLDDMSDIIADISEASPEEAADMARLLSTARREANDMVYELFALPEYSGAIGEREVIAKAYFEQVDAYYGQVDAIFAPLNDPSLTSEERSLVFENWRQFQNENMNKPIVIDGVAYPNEMERSWNGKTEEERHSTRMRDLAKKPEWLSKLQISRIAEEFPQAVKYLPSDSTEYDMLTDLKNEVNELVAQGELSTYRKNQVVDAAEEIFTQRMLDQGRHDELLWINATPLERLDLIGNVPPMLEAIMPEYRNVVQTFRANDLSLASTSPEAVKVKVAFFTQVANHLASIPGGAQQFYDLGLEMFGDDFDSPDEIGAVLFFNDRFNDL